MVRTVATDHNFKRQHILKVSAAVFSREGVAFASMNEIAKACGISKANIYHYYASKNDLLFDILDNYLYQLRLLTCDADRSSLTPEAKLYSIAQDFLIAYEGMDNEHKIQSEGLHYLEEERQNILKAYQRDMVSLVANVLNECSPDVLARDYERCRHVTMSLFGMLNWFYMWNSDSSRDQRKQYASLIVDLILHGITKANNKGINRDNTKIV